MKKALYWIGGICALVVAGAFVAIHTVDTAFISEKVSKAVEEATGAPLKFSSAPSITLLPPGVAFEEVSWDTIKEGQGLRFTAKSGSASMELSPLLSGNIVIGEVSLDSPSMEILMPDQPAAPNKDTSLPKTEKPNAVTLPSSLPLELETLTVTKGTLIYAQGSQKYHLENINISIQHLSNNTDAALTCSLDYMLRGLGEELSGTLELAGKANLFTELPSISDLSLKVTPSGSGFPASFGSVQFTGNASFNPGTQILDLKGLNLSVPTAKAMFTGTASLKNLSTEGNFQLSAAPRAIASLYGIKLPDSDQDSLSLKGTVAASSKEIKFSGLEGALDTTTLKSDMHIVLGDILSIRGAVALGELNLDAYIPSSDTSQEKPQAKETAPAEKQEKNAVWPSVDMRLDMASLKWKGLNVRNIQILLQGSAGDYTLEKLAASLESGGTLDASGRARLNKNNYAIKFKANDINIGPIMEAQGKGRSAEGTAHAQADLTATGKDASEIIASLAGSGELEAENLSIKALSELLKSHPVLKEVVSPTFTQMKAPFTASQGVLKFSPVTATSEALNATATATASLPKQYVQGSATIKTLGMSIPINIEGPFTNISYRLDPRFAVDVLKSVGGAVLEGGKSAGSTVIDGGKAAGSFASETARETGSAVKDMGTAIKNILPW